LIHAFAFERARQALRAMRIDLEARLWRFKTLFEAGEVDALCFLLPTRVAATGIFARQRAAAVPGRGR